MQRRKTIEYTTTRTVTELVTCDLCGKEATQPNDPDRLWESPTEPFDCDTITIKRETGARYPDAANLERDEYDVCPECWTSKIVPLFAGVAPRKTEIDY